jgi:hypothetical protein
MGSTPRAGGGGDEGARRLEGRPEPGATDVLPESGGVLGARRKDGARSPEPGAGRRFSRSPEN